MNVKTSNDHATCGYLVKVCLVLILMFLFVLLFFAGLTARTGSTKRPLRRETFCWTESRNCPELSTCKMEWSLWLCERPWWLYLILVCLISLIKSYFFCVYNKKKTFSDNVFECLHFKLSTCHATLWKPTFKKYTKHFVCINNCINYFFIYRNLLQNK